MAVHHCHLDKNPPPQSITIEVTIKSTTCHLVIQLEFKMTNTELLSMAIFLLANDSSEHCGRSEHHLLQLIIIAPITNFIVNIVVCRFHQINQFPNHFFVTFYAENYFVALRSSLAVLSSASVRTIVLLTDSLKMMLMLMMKKMMKKMMTIQFPPG